MSVLMPFGHDFNEVSLQRSLLVVVIRAQRLLHYQRQTSCLCLLLSVQINSRAVRICRHHCPERDLTAFAGQFSAA